MTVKIDALALKTMINDGQELALLDVREHGQYGEGHLLFAVSIPYSMLEAELAARVPRRSVRVVLVDGGDGVAERAAERSRAQPPRDGAAGSRRLARTACEVP